MVNKASSGFARTAIVTVADLVSPKKEALVSCRRQVYREALRQQHVNTVGHRGISVCACCESVIVRGKA